MSAFIDFEDKSVDKAIEKACKELNIVRDQLKYDIISHGSSGIFGIVGTKKALIRVTPPQSAAEGQKSEAGAPELKKKRKTPAAKQKSAVSALVDEAFGENNEEDNTDEPAASPEAPPEAPLVAPDDANDALPDIHPETEPPLDEDASEEIEMPKEPAAKTEDIKAASDWINGFLSHAVALISPDSEVQMKNNDDVVRFKITGGTDAARLIGKRGQTLDAIQYLAEKTVTKQFGSGIHFEIDVEDYLDKRRTELIQLATRLAEKAQQTGKPMVINRINAQDRRVVHIALKENREIRTQSAGNGELRKLLILPKKKAPGRKPEPRKRKRGNGRQKNNLDASAQKTETGEQGS